MLEILRTDLETLEKIYSSLDKIGNHYPSIDIEELFISIGTLIEKLNKLLKEAEDKLA